MADQTQSHAGDAGAKPATIPMDQWTPEQVSHWEGTGELPGDAKDAPAIEGTEKADTPAEAAAAEPAEQAASRDAKTEVAPEAAKPEKSKKQPGQKKSAKERADEINAEAAAEERELAAALERRARARAARREAEREEPSPKAEKGAEAAAATTEPAWKRYRNHPDAPKIKDFEDLDDWGAAMSAFSGEHIAKEQFQILYDQRSREERASMSAESRFVEQLREADTRVTAELQADPEILERIDDRWKALNPSDRLAAGETASWAHFIKDHVTFHCQHTLKLSEWLASRESQSAELRRLVKLGVDRGPQAVIRELVIKDASFDQESETTQDPAGARPHPRVSKAPAPAPTLGKKAAAGVDPLKKAIDENDFDTFNELESKREMAGRRR